MTHDIDKPAAPPVERASNDYDDDGWPVGIRSSCGRAYLSIIGYAVAMQGDVIRDPDLNEQHGPVWTLDALHQVVDEFAEIHAPPTVADRATVEPPAAGDLVAELVRLENDIVDHAEDTYWCGHGETVCERIYAVLCERAPDATSRLRFDYANGKWNQEPPAADDLLAAVTQHGPYAEPPADALSARHHPKAPSSDKPPLPVRWKRCSRNDAEQFRHRVLTGSIGLEGAWSDWQDGRIEYEDSCVEYEYRRRVKEQPEAPTDAAGCEGCRYEGEGLPFYAACCEDCVRHPEYSDNFTPREDALPEHHHPDAPREGARR